MRTTAVNVPGRRWRFPSALRSCRRKQLHWGGEEELIIDVREYNRPVLLERPREPERYGGVQAPEVHREGEWTGPC